MRRTVHIVPFACLMLSGCLSMDGGPGPEATFVPNQFGSGIRQPQVPGVQGPYGQSVPMAAPYSYRPPASSFQAAHMMKDSMPLNMVQMNSPNMAAQMGMTAPGAVPPQMVMPAGGMLSPPGVPFAPGAPAPGGMMPPFPPGRGGMPPMPGGGMPGGGMPPMLGGGMPGRGMPGRGMPPMPPMPPSGAMPGGDSGIMQASFNQPGAPRTDDRVSQAMYGMVAGFGAMPQSDGVRFSVQRTQVRFLRPTGMRIAWFTRGPDGKPAYSTTPLEAPGRYNFQQGAVYRLKLSNIERRPGLEVYPTLEVVPVNARTEAFLAHSAVPIEFTDEDFNQIAQGNLVVKVIYLPDPQYQEYAGTGIDQILSTQLEPGADPIKEALRRGSILLVIRMGNVDQEAPNTPPLGSASTSNTSANAGMNGMNGMNPMCPPPMVPYIMPSYPVPPGCVLPAPPPGMQPDGKDGKDGKDAGPPKQQDAMAVPGAMPNLAMPPQGALAGPPESVKAAPVSDSSLTGRGILPDMPPEIGPPPSQAPDDSAPMGSSAPPAPAIPQELLNAMPPAESRRVPIRMPGDATATFPSDDLPSIEDSRPPADAQSDGRPTMLPETDPGQPAGSELQRISGTRPNQLP